MYNLLVNCITFNIAVNGSPEGAGRNQPASTTVHGQNHPVHPGPQPVHTGDQEVAAAQLE